VPGYTYTYLLTNGTSADADQVQQNFNDAKNGVQDGTKDIAVSAFSASGAATFQGHVTLGNATNDDITVTGSLASSIPVKTTFSYDIGTSIVGLRDIYLGSADSAARTTKIRGATVASSWTLTTPTSGGSAGQFLATDGSGTTSWMDGGPGLAMNYSIAASVASSALTISVKGADGNALSATNFARFAFRNSTATTGTPVVRSATSISDLVISSGSTLGHTSAVAGYIYVGLVDNAGTLEIVATSTMSLYDEGTRVSTTAEGGAGAADSLTAIYSTAARTDLPVRWIGRLKSSQATAGTWATAISEISLAPFKGVSANVQLSSSSGTFADNDTSETAVTNLSRTFTSTGGLVHIKLVPDGTSNESFFGMIYTLSVNQADMTMTVYIYRDSTLIYKAGLQSSGNGGTKRYIMPASSVNVEDTPPAGSYTYSVKYLVGSTAYNAYFQYLKLQVWEG
jgi:hypothetical protein